MLVYKYKAKVVQKSQTIIKYYSKFEILRHQQ